MGADASKTMLVDPSRMVTLAMAETSLSSNSNSSFRLRKSRNGGSGGSHQSDPAGLVGKLLRGQYHAIDASRVTQQEAAKAVCLKLDNEQELWVLPLHVAVALPDIPLQTVKDILRANPEAVYQHTTLTEAKLRRIIHNHNPADDVSVMSRSVASTLHSSYRNGGGGVADSGRVGTATGRDGGDDNDDNDAVDEDNEDQYGLRQDAGWGAGWLPLHVAVWYGGSLDTLRYLLAKAPSSVYCKTTQGHLALHLACARPARPNAKHISTLVEAFPASIHVSTSDNAMATDLFRDNRHKRNHPDGHPDDDNEDDYDNDYRNDMPDPDNHDDGTTPSSSTSFIMDLLTGSNTVSRRYDPLPRCIQSIPSTRR